MLQLMSLSLDTWGSMHVEAQLAHKSPGLALIEKSELPLLSLMGLSLDSWGTNEGNISTEHSLDNVMTKAPDLLLNPLAQVLPSEANLIDPRGYQARSMSFLLEPQQKNQLMNLGIVIFILLVLAVILCYLCWEGSELDEDDALHSPTQEVQQDFATVEFSDGSWAQVYREARGEQKEALELLFRCNIISTDEFAFSSVSQEHIQECIWIATHMLRQKPLEEWVALWQQAQQTFEDSVTACFEARGGPHSSFSSSLHMHPSMAASGLSLGAVPLLGRGTRSGNTSIVEEDEEDDPYTTRSHYSPHSTQDPAVQGARIPDSQNTVDSEQSHWSIENELDHGVAMHGGK